MSIFFTQFEGLEYMEIDGKKGHIGLLPILHIKGSKCELRTG